MGCTSSKEVKEVQDSHKLKGVLMTQRRELDQSKRRESTLLHNLVHEEFRRNINEWLPPLRGALVPVAAAGRAPRSRELANFKYNRLCSVSPPPLLPPPPPLPPQAYDLQTGRQLHAGSFDAATHRSSAASPYGAGGPFGAGSVGAVRAVYDLQTGRPLGAGSFGTVRAVTHRTSGKEFALKTVEIKGLKDEAQFNLFMNELEVSLAAAAAVAAAASAVEAAVAVAAAAAGVWSAAGLPAVQHAGGLLPKLDHPSVARLQEVYHSPDYVFMVMDLYGGGDLVDRQRIRTEHDAAAVVRAIVDGIRYCHDHRIAHRDLKLENILYEHKGADAGIKIVDFGLGVAGADASMMRDIVGTWIYMSPEVLKGKHSPYATTRPRAPLRSAPTPSTAAAQRGAARGAFEPSSVAEGREKPRAEGSGKPTSVQLSDPASPCVAWQRKPQGATSRCATPRRARVSEMRRIGSAWAPFGGASITLRRLPASALHAARAVCPGLRRSRAPVPWRAAARAAHHETLCPRKTRRMWSIGVITYTLMVGRFPFMADSLQMLQHKIQFVPPDLDSPDWEVASNECKDFITKLLQKDPTRRMSAKEAQAHPWLNLKRSRTAMHFAPLGADVTARLKSFKDQSVLKRAAPAARGWSAAAVDCALCWGATRAPFVYSVIACRCFVKYASSPSRTRAFSRWAGARWQRVERCCSRLCDARSLFGSNRVALEIVARTLEPKQICYLEAEFRKADKEGTGELSLETFRQVMRESALLRDKDIDQIFKSLDVGCCGTIHFTDFMAAGLLRGIAAARRAEALRITSSMPCSAHSGAVAAGSSLRMQERAVLPCLKWHKLDERRLRLAFDRLDHDGSGYITLENLQFTVGSDLTDQQMREAIAEFDHDKDGKATAEFDLDKDGEARPVDTAAEFGRGKDGQIGFPEFCAGMRKSGADLGVLSTATITSRNLAAFVVWVIARGTAAVTLQLRCPMSRMVSTQTLQRLASGMDAGSDDELYAGGEQESEDMFDDEDAEATQRRHTDLQDQQEEWRRSAKSERDLHNGDAHRAGAPHHAKSNGVDPQLQAAATSIVARRATSETGKDLNHSLHGRRAAARARAAAAHSRPMSLNNLLPTIPDGSEAGTSVAAATFATNRV
ncbi:hypothetical protein JKP88DRAFT_310469 [Tribonema minus]|uniref:Uncharacterized protein n=1 Tax=Tribonema minus TaxID=303371 RepID=A0A835ZBQ6_9STRA|nr:hypothetical protein JKP88DRAFT_310469 [Tribonema minus]